MRVCSQAPPWARPCACHVATTIRNKCMHVAKHVHTHVKSRYTCRCHPHPKGHFHRTRNKCKREYALPEAELHAIAIRKIQFGLPKSGNTKVVPRKTVHRHDHVDYPTTAWTLLSRNKQKHLNKHVYSRVCAADAGWPYSQRNQTRRSRNQQRVVHIV